MEKLDDGYMEDIMEDMFLLMAQENIPWPEKFGLYEKKSLLLKMKEYFSHCEQFEKCSFLTSKLEEIISNEQ